MKRALVTGASGFIGRQVLAPLLRLGLEVHVTSRAPLGIATLHEHRVDLFDESAVAQLLDSIRPSVLLHLAWFTKSPDYWHSPLNDEWESRSIHLFESFIRNGGERILGTGSCAEYEWGSDLLKEGSTPERPATHYGRAKLSLLRRTDELTKESGISFSWARFFFLFGPHERKERFVPSIVDPLLRGDVAFCRNGSLLRDFLYVEDAGDAVVALATSDVQGPVNVASGISSRLGDLARDIGAAMHLPALVHIDEGESSSTQPGTVVADITRLTHEVGWRPRYDRNDAIERTIAWRAAQERVDAA